MYRVMSYPQLTLLRRMPLGGIIQLAICPAVVRVQTNRAIGFDAADPCPLSGVKQTLIGDAAMSAFDPKRTWAVSKLLPCNLTQNPIPSVTNPYCNCVNSKA